MTLKYYAEKILPKHIDEVKRLQERYHHQHYLQEDNDGSHGTRSWDNPARRLKTDAGIALLTHPAQSPDLNPIEGLWLILKKRLRGGSWQTVAEFKEAIRAAWRSITRAQIRRRIREMPERCEKLCNNEGTRIKSDLW